MNYLQGTFIPGLITCLFMFGFLGIYQIFDFPTFILKQKLKLKNQFYIFLIIIFIPFLIGVLLANLIGHLFVIPGTNINLLISACIGFMWSLVYKFTSFD